MYLSEIDDLGKCVQLMSPKPKVIWWLQQDIHVFLWPSLSIRFPHWQASSLSKVECWVLVRWVAWTSHFHQNWDLTMCLNRSESRRVLKSYRYNHQSSTSYAQPLVTVTCPFLSVHERSSFFWLVMESLKWVSRAGNWKNVTFSTPVQFYIDSRIVLCINDLITSKIKCIA
jgi:hypothetical protein